MPLRPMLPAILLALVMSIMVAVLAAGRGSGMTLALAVALFALQMLFVALRINAPFWGSSPPATEGPATVACAQTQRRARRPRLCLGRHRHARDLLAHAADVAPLVAVRRRHAARSPARSSSMRMCSLPAARATAARARSTS